MKVSVRKTECQSKKCPENQKCVVTFTQKDPIVSLYLPSGYMFFKREEKCYCSDGSEGLYLNQSQFFNLCFSISVFCKFL